MCGFVGFASTGSRARPPRTLADRWLDDLAHRGPDASGRHVDDRWLLVATRLAIQGDARSDPPLTSGDGRIVLAFNGEILGAAVERMRRRVAAAGLEVPERTAGDGRLLVEAVAALAHRPEGIDGPSLLGLLEGSMGAIAVLDRAQGATWLARDRLGIKPLYVLEAEDGFLFASELRPLLRAVPGTRVIDPAGLGELLRWQRPRHHLPFRGVQALPPGAAWRVTGGGHVTRWAGGQGIRDLVDRDAAGASDAVERLRAAWSASAAAAADVTGTPSLFLSGGLDSSAVATWAARPDLVALTGRFAPAGGDLDESAAAAAVARQAGIRHEILDLADEDLVADLPGVVEALEIPMAGPGALSLWRLARRARELGRVVLTGTGGDELLAGYARTALVLGRAGPWTRGYEALAARVDAAGDDPALRHAAVGAREADLVGLLDPDFRSTLTAPPVGAAWARPGMTGAQVLDALVAEEVEATLPMLLHVEDRVAMAHGIEGRPVPCLGDVPRVAAGLPAAWLVGPDGEGKRALRVALAGAVPDAVLADRRKRGFPTPFARAARGAGRSRVEALFDDRRFRERGWWNVDACRRALDDSARPVHDRALYALLSWEWWARAFLDGDALGPET